MLVLVPFGQMQPEAGGHQGARDQETGRQRVAQEQDGQDRADEGRQREIGAGAGGAKMAQGQDEQDQADAVAEQAAQASGQDGTDNPLTMAIRSGSAAESLRVKLLWTPEARRRRRRPEALRDRGHRLAPATIGPAHRPGSRTRPAATAGPRSRGRPARRWPWWRGSRG